MNSRTILPVAACALLALLAMDRTGGFARQGAPAPEFTTDFDLNNAVFSPNGGNQYFSLRPGTFLRFEGDDDGEFVELEIEALDQIKIITFDLNGESITARCRVVREREWADGELVEISRNYFTRDTRNGNIYYCGEDVDIFENGVIVDHEGAWRAGVDGALPGLIMPSIFLLGSRYYQEHAPGVALDKGRNAESGLTIDTPAGTFENCVLVRETSDLEDGVSIKVYAPGVGLIEDDGVQLTEFSLP